jgi:hypothetical protein
MLVARRGSHPGGWRHWRKLAWVINFALPSTASDGLATAWERPAPISPTARPGFLE